LERELAVAATTQFGGMMSREQVSISIERLHLDPNNPRLPEEAIGKSERELLRVLYREFNLAELAESLAKNGYFREEPLVAIPRSVPKDLSRPPKELSPQQLEMFSVLAKADDTHFIVVEGNRRLATCKLLIDSALRKELGIRQWPSLSTETERDLASLPAIIYNSSDEVVPYMGVRHIVGIQKWDPFAKARYIARLVSQGRNMTEIEQVIGDTRGSARKSYVCYKLIKQLEEDLDFDTKKAKSNFSFLILSIGQASVRKFLGLPRLNDVDEQAPVAGPRLEHLRQFASWIYGDEKSDPVIQESRDITGLLTHVLASEDATAHLENTRRLKDAYELSDGEEKMVIRKLRQANSNLETALGVVHRHRTEEVLDQIDKCLETANRLQKTVQNES
jgi:hypothetical protein